MGHIMGHSVYGALDISCRLDVNTGLEHKAIFPSMVYNIDRWLDRYTDKIHSNSKSRIQMDITTQAASEAADFYLMFIWPTVVRHTYSN